MFYFLLFLVVVLAMALAFSLAGRSELKDRVAFLEREKEQYRPNHSQELDKAYKYASRLERETEELTNKNKVLQGEIENLNLEKEIFPAFPSLQGYLSSLFSWLSQEISRNPDTIFSAARQKNVPVKAVLCALLFFQVSEQIRYEESKEDVSEIEKFRQYLLDKLSAYKYFDEDSSDQEK